MEVGHSIRVDTIMMTRRSLIQRVLSAAAGCVLARTAFVGPKADGRSIGLEMQESANRLYGKLQESAEDDTRHWFLECVGGPMDRQIARIGLHESRVCWDGQKWWSIFEPLEPEPTAERFMIMDACCYRRIPLGRPPYEDYVLGHDSLTDSQVMNMLYGHYRRRMAQKWGDMLTPATSPAPNSAADSLQPRDHAI